jgi:hypothetical protein
VRALLFILPECNSRALFSLYLVTEQFNAPAGSARAVLLYNIVTSIRRRSSALHTNKCTRRVRAGAQRATLRWWCDVLARCIRGRRRNVRTQPRHLNSRVVVLVCILYARRLVFSNTARIRPHNKLPPGDFIHTESFVYSPRAHHRLNGAYIHKRADHSQLGSARHALSLPAIWR